MKKIFLSKIFLVLCSIVCIAAGYCGFRVQIEAKAANENISATIERLEMIEADDTAIFYLSETDYITAEFDENDDTVARYKWVDSLAYEDRESYNVHNAVLNQNADSYNYAENILIDGVALKNYEHQLVANKYQRIAGLGLTFPGANGVFANASEISIKAGCTLPTLEGGYFGVSQRAIVLSEDTVFRKREGVWARGYVFNGYEANVTYDASEEFFYKRVEDSAYKGHTEAPTCQFSVHYQAAGDDMALASAKNTDKGNLFVLDFVNPIDTSVFGKINLRFYVHEPRTMVTYNAYSVTETSLGEKLEDVSTAPGWSVVSLMAPLYADENGMLDRLVFQFTNDGDMVNAERNYVAIGEFSLGAEQIEGLVYEQSLLIDEREDSYGLTFRFNKKGEFANASLDFTKVCINGESLEEIHQKGDFVTAKWASIQGIYQINITLSKAYNGDGQMKNPSLDYACNKITVLEGLSFPNGELLDKTYNYHIFRAFRDSQKFEKEIIIDYGVKQSFEETKATGISWEFQESANNNIHMSIQFDKNITSKMIVHACEPEDWRESILPEGVLFDSVFNEGYVTGGYKTSMMNSLVINGKTIAEWHMTGAHPTCVMVSYGQIHQSVLEVYIDKNSPDYAAIAALFESGEGVTVEIKKGFQFTTGVRTEQDCSFVLQGGTFVAVDKSDFAVYFDGIPVKEGEVLEVDYKALSSHIYVEGAEKYQVTETEEGNVKTFTVTAGDKTFTFQVKQTVTLAPDPKEEGCGSSIAMGSLGLVATFVACAAFIAGRKRDEA
ncbi:MAG: hypothetical protein IJX49_03175 [Clostridia bacterium]|nr:hypothetical protein [Clostridia bacterium]